jgi:outer membrane protein
MNLFKYIFLIPIIITLEANAQESLLSKRSAVDIALENNYDIKIAEGNVESAANSSSVQNSGYLPSISAGGGANYNVVDNFVEAQDGSNGQENGVQTYAFNASVAVNYTVYDGSGRKYNYARLKENYNLSELQARQVIENSIVNIFATYYEVARLTQNVNSQVETIDISRRRLRRARFGYEYGQNTQLDVLNAEVDYNNDSITFRNLSLELSNVKRDLNVLLGRDVSIDFMVDTTITYMNGLAFETLMDRAIKNNVTVLQNEGLVRTTEYGVKIDKSALIPNIGLSASYNYNDRNNGSTAPFKHQTTIGPTVNANLSWNIFDGGLSKVRIQNSKIAVRNQQIVRQQNLQVLQRNVNNAWAFYENALFVLEAEEKNYRTNELNFERTLEQQKLGQITSIEFRQAQLNLLNAKLNYNRAKYSAKTAELALLQISGDLMLAEF